MKKNIFLLLFFFSLQIHSYNYSTIWDFFMGRTGIGKQSAEVLKEASTTLGADAKDVAVTLADGAKEASANVGVEAVKTVAEVAVPVLAIYSVWSMGKDVQNGCKSIYNWYYPSPEDLARKEACLKRVAYLRAERAFLRSLVDSRCTERGASGLPIVCESHAKEFIAAGGEEQVEKMTKYFHTSPLFNDCPC